tara:strand:- start:214 stop:549 length:336 start_codon:yes stop_codon:yes gene_type:complete
VFDVRVKLTLKLKGFNMAKAYLNFSQNFGPAAVAAHRKLFVQFHNNDLDPWQQASFLAESVGPPLKRETVDGVISDLSMFSGGRGCVTYIVSTFINIITLNNRLLDRGVLT